MPKWTHSPELWHSLHKKWISVVDLSMNWSHTQSEFFKAFTFLVHEIIHRARGIEFYTPFLSAFTRWLTAYGHSPCTWSNAFKIIALNGSNRYKQVGFMKASSRETVIFKYLHHNSSWLSLSSSSKVYGQFIAWSVSWYVLKSSTQACVFPWGFFQFRRNQHLNLINRDSEEVQAWGNPCYSLFFFSSRTSNPWVFIRYITHNFE